MDSRRGPPSKVARTAASSRDSSQDRGSPEPDEPEERARRVARRLSQEEPSDRPAGGVDVATGDEEIIVVDDYQDEQTRGRRDSVDSAASGVGHVHISAAAAAASEARAARNQDDERLRPRGGTRREPARELNTCPENIQVTCISDPSKFRQIDVLSNFIRVEPMKERHIYQYRVDFEPNVESRPQRRYFFREGTRDVFSKRPGFDGMHDIYCSQLLPDKETVMKVEHPVNKEEKVELKITCVREVDWGSFEMMRVYNLHMKRFLQYLGFYQITVSGSWVHSELSTPIADGKALAMVRGFKTATHVYDKGNILVQLEAVHKLMQRRNVLQVMADIRAQRPANLREALSSELTGKLVITNYNKRIYRIESVRFDVKPTLTFEDKKEKKQISYVDYYRSRYAMEISDLNQPMLQVVPNNKRGKNERGEEGQTQEILLVPELCNITGLTEQQRNDPRLKMDLIKSSQIAPHVRVQQMETFMRKFNENVDIREALKEWGYEYEKTPVRLKAHVLPVTKIGYSPDPKAFQPVNAQSADFNVNELAMVPKLDNLYIVCTRADMGNKADILSNLRRGFEKVKLRPVSVKQIDISQGDAPADYIKCLRALPNDLTAVVVIMHNQNKEKYDSIKKIATVERGLVTQCVTARLMLDQKKIAGASVKIAIQVAAKIGGEPWWADIPLKRAMICGYDTARDTAKRGVNYGALLASLNEHFSRWYSRANAHDQVEQVSSQITEAFTEAVRKYKELNGNYPDRVFIYRDGVGEGALGLVYETELVKIRDALRKIDPNIKLTMIVVNKRVGARFFMRNNQQSFANPPPGSVIDQTVTRAGRYDFYLVSQSTRQGTVAPTYYNIIHDESNMLPEHHQMMAHKLCLLYYNWSGSVRVPAPCQYAQKLASLCGEHLHAQPNDVLNERLHFL